MLFMECVLCSSCLTRIRLSKRLMRFKKTKTIRDSNSLVPIPRQLKLLMVIGNGAILRVKLPEQSCRKTRDCVVRG